MARIVAVLMLAVLLVVAALFSTLMFLGHGLAGEFVAAVVWLGAAMGAVLGAVCVVVLNGPPAESDESEND